VKDFEKIRVQEESNFEEIEPKEFDRPLLIVDNDLKDKSNRGLNFVRDYSEKLQTNLDSRNVRMMKLDVLGADTLIENDFLKKE